MKIKVIEGTDKRIFESDVNFFIEGKKVFNIQYTQSYSGNMNIRMSAMIVYEEDNN